MAACKVTSRCCHCMVHHVELLTHEAYGKGGVLGVRVFQVQVVMFQKTSLRVGRDAKTCRFRVPTFRASEVHDFFSFFS